MKRYKNVYIKTLYVKDTGSCLDSVKIHTSKIGVDYARSLYADDIEIYESFWVILLNRANRSLGCVKISQGGTSGTIVDNKLIAKYAIESLAHAIILVHNHPSGNLNPSNADKDITQKCKEALKLFDIQVIDHIILTKDSYLSFSDEGIL